MHLEGPGWYWIDFHRIPRGLIVDSSALTGLGAHVTRLHIGACPHYLVVASARAETTLVALRVRAGVR